MSSGDDFARAMQLYQAGRLIEAVGFFQKSLALAPDQVECLNSLGIALGMLGRLDEALDAYWRALKIQPQNAGVYYNAGMCSRRWVDFSRRRRHGERRWRSGRILLKLLNNLGLLLTERGLLAESVQVFNQLLAIDPNAADLLNNLSNSLKDLGKTDEAYDVLRRAAEAKPDDGKTYNNLGGILSRMGRVDEAIAAHRRAMELDPADAMANSNLIFAMSFHPACDAAAILREARKWDERHGKPLRRLIRPHGNSRDVDRRLRVGYVSPDLRQHVVGWNLLPLLRQHDRSRYEIFCYGSVLRPDSMTEDLRGFSDQWRDVLPLSDELSRGADQGGRNRYFD